MRVVITGGAGFIGRRLVRKILETGTLTKRDGSVAEVSRLVVTDVVEPETPLSDDARLQFVAGDFATGRDRISELHSEVHLYPIAEFEKESACCIARVRRTE